MQNGYGYAPAHGLIEWGGAENAWQNVLSPKSPNRHILNKTVRNLNKNNANNEIGEDVHSKPARPKRKKEKLALQLLLLPPFYWNIAAYNIKIQNKYYLKMHKIYSALISKLLAIILIFKSPPTPPTLPMIWCGALAHSFQTPDKLGIHSHWCQIVRRWSRKIVLTDQWLCPQCRLSAAHWLNIFAIQYFQQHDSFLHREL